MNSLPAKTDVQSISFLLHELLINIYKHSRFENACIKIDVKDEIEIQIIDDGIGIPGSFSEGNITYKKINGKSYPYYQWTQDGKQRSRIVKPEELDDLKQKIEQRKVLEKKLRDENIPIIVAINAINKPKRISIVFIFV